MSIGGTISRWGIRIGSLGLLIFTMYRSIHFIEATLPADKKVMAYFALIALGIGGLLWLIYYIRGAEGIEQKAIAILMVVVCFGGELMAFSGDTLYQAGESGMIDQLDTGVVTNIIYFITVVIGANILAFVGVEIFDPDTMKKHAEEAAKQQTYRLALKHIQENANTFAAEWAPKIAAGWTQEQESQVKGAVKVEMIRADEYEADMEDIRRGIKRDRRRERRAARREQQKVPAGVGSNHNGNLPD